MIPRDRLVLGTAKFGLPWYGYGSTSRPTAHDALAILRHAWEADVCHYDTALGYSDAMALLGAADIPLSTWIVKARLPLRVRDGWQHEAALVHNPSIVEMRHLRHATGVSVYTVAEVAEARRLGHAPIQAPASCLNPPVEVEYARAPFLQGVVLREPGRAPAALQTAVAAFQRLADAAGVSRVALALHAAWRREDGFLVFGVSSVAQLDAVLAAAEQDVPAEVVRDARALGRTVDATAALPSLWSAT